MEADENDGWLHRGDLGENKYRLDRVGRWCTIVSTPRLMIRITTIRRSSLTHLTPNGFPPHLLKLKIGCPIILLRNIDPANGLCNGTRLVVRGFQRNSIDAEIVLGQHAKKRVFLPRIPLCPYDDEMFPFQFKMKQFPIRVSFAMTINKSQGQTIPNVGVYLPSPVFSHGQLYVAMSRATARTNIKILTLPPNAEADEEQTKKKEKKKSL
ncbi:hypothetical protein SEVIR_5G168250v4 [Setaria viridis]